MPMTLLVTIELSLIALFGMAVALRKISASRRVARIRVTVDPVQKRINRLNR